MPRKPWPSSALSKLIKEDKPHIVEVALVALYTGQSRKDVLSMASVDIEDGIWNVWRHKTRRKVKERNPVPLHPVVLEIVNAALERRKAARIVDPKRLPLTTSHCTIWSSNGFSPSWNKEMARLKLNGEGYIFQGLRKTNAQMIARAVAAAGGSEYDVLQKVRSMLSHHSDKMERHYAGEAARSAANRETVAMLPDKIRN